MSQLDVLFVNPGNHKQIYQGLSNKYSAIETPTWSLLLAQSCRSIGHSVGILDASAEQLTVEQTVDRIQEISPRLICFVVYGQNPNSGTVNMSGTVVIAKAIKDRGIEQPVAVVGSHVQALPLQTIEEQEDIDIVCTNEGVYALWSLLSASDMKDPDILTDIKGIAFRKDNKAFLTVPEIIVPQEKMDEHLPGYAWDLLPYREKPLDLYRAPMWHADYIMRFWSPEFIIKEFDKLVEMGVKTLRISDEMFLLNRKYYVPLCNLLKERGYGEFLNMWAYSRVDTVNRPENLKLIREAGIKWLCLGIESGDRKVRLMVTKGRFKDVDIRDVVKMVHDADIEIIANYLFGLPGDDHRTMQTTLDLSLELCTLAWNAYAAMALPGSQLYRDAVKAGHELPKDFAAYSFHSYDTLPLPTEHLSPAEILKFRDESWQKYHTHIPFLEKVEAKFGPEARTNIEDMTKIKLKRRILGE